MRFLWLWLRGGRIGATVCQGGRIGIWNGFNGYLLDTFDTDNVISC